MFMVMSLFGFTLSANALTSVATLDFETVEYDAVNNAVTFKVNGIPAGLGSVTVGVERRLPIPTMPYVVRNFDVVGGTAEGTLLPGELEASSLHQYVLVVIAAGYFPAVELIPVGASSPALPVIESISAVPVNRVASFGGSASVQFDVTGTNFQSGGLDKAVYFNVETPMWFSMAGEPSVTVRSDTSAMVIVPLSVQSNHLESVRSESFVISNTINNKTAQAWISQAEKSSGDFLTPLQAALVAAVANPAAANSQNALSTAEINGLRRFNVEGLNWATMPTELAAVPTVQRNVVERMLANATLVGGTNVPNLTPLQKALIAAVANPAAAGSQNALSTAEINGLRRFNVEGLNWGTLPTELAAVPTVQRNVVERMLANSSN